MNPEFRQRLQHFTRNIESANEAAQENIYTFTQLYIDPCIIGVKLCVYECTAPCFPNREDQLRRRRRRSRGGAEFDFDFYDDWDEEELGGSRGLGWGTGELDGLLAGRGSSQPGRPRAMSYGARRRRDEADSDPTVIPKSSYLGFLERLPFRFGSTGMKYKPSAANLEENPGGLRIRDVESTEPLLDDGEEGPYQKGHSRQRSGTAASRSTITSHSSRGDLIMSDEEEDAIPLDDEFATNMLSRRTTGTGLLEDMDVGKGRRSGGASRISSRTVSTRSIQGQDSPQLVSKRSSKSAELPQESPQSSNKVYEPPTLVDLKREEEELRQQEELEIVQKREAAQNLAQSIGLDVEIKMPGSDPKHDQDQATPVRTPLRHNTTSGYFALSSPVSPLGETEPFPNLGMSRLGTPRSPQSPTSVRERANDEAVQDPSKDAG